MSPVNWLSEQLDYANSAIETWPEWMQQASRSYEYNHSSSQFQILK